MELNEVLKMQKRFRKNASGLNINLRIKLLKRLYLNIEFFEDEICACLKSDLGKSREEAYLTEVATLKSEIKEAILKLPLWSREKCTLPSLMTFPSYGKIVSQPYGTALILAPWNYPFYLSLAPLVGAISAGNTAVIKPSKKAPETAKVLEKIIAKSFAPWQVFLLSPKKYSYDEIFSYKYDICFFTGSERVGKIVMEKCAETLTPCHLELGGKSPAIVDKSANLYLASKKIAWGKLLNSGQTCVAPDYVIVHKSVKDKFVKLLEKQFKSIYPNPLKNNNYPKIVDDVHIKRVNDLTASAMLSGDELLFGGSFNLAERRFEPTCFLVRSLESPLMKEELFSPLLPILTFEKFEEIGAIISKNQNPLALYSFGSKEFTKKCTESFSFGGGCENDSVLHLANVRLPFGGVGKSGIGSYHGKAGFDAFSHEKSVLVSPRFFDVPLRYPPFGKVKKAIIKKIL